MTHFKDSNQWNFGTYQKKILRPIQIVKKNNELFRNSNSHIYTKIIYFIAYFGPSSV